MKQYFAHWNFMRILRLALGIFIIIQGIQEKEWLFIALGGLFALMPVLNIGCCSTTASCCDKPVAETKRKPEEISYEEVR